MANQLLDKILGSLSADALRYFFPGFTKKEHKEEVQDIIEDEFSHSFRPAEDSEVRFSVGSEKDSGIRFRTGDAGNAFSYSRRPVPGTERPDLDLPGIEDIRRKAQKKNHEEKRKSKKSIFKDFGPLFTEDDEKQERIPAKAEDRRALERQEAARYRKDKPKSLIEGGKSVLRSIMPEPKPEDLELDARTKALVKEIEELQRKYGVTIEELEAVLSYRVKVSRLRITRHHDIILEDFDRQEVRMDTLTKAVFLLYLKHPEGIRYKDLCDHRRELEGIYMSISGRSDLEGIRKSISDLTDSIMSNSINEKVSKAKKAFRDVVDDRVARFYYIEGKQGAAKRIALDRSLVIWE